jgi:hypothetical protein
MQDHEPGGREAHCLLMSLDRWAIAEDSWIGDQLVGDKDSMFNILTCRSADSWGRVKMRGTGGVWALLTGYQLSMQVDGMLSLTPTRLHSSQTSSCSICNEELTKEQNHR